MEMIPLVDQPGDPVPETTPVQDANLSGHEPLVVEPLENRVLLAADVTAAAPIADVPATEPAPYVAAPQTHHLDIDLQDLVETPDASEATGHAAGEGVVQGQNSHAQPHQPEAEKVENKTETAVEELPENKDSIEPESNRNEFGLATIEPPKSAVEAAMSSGEHVLLGGLAADDDAPSAGAETDTPARDRAESGTQSNPIAFEGVAVRVAADLDAVLVKAASVELQVEAIDQKLGSSDDTSTKSLSANKGAAVLAQTVLRAEPLAETLSPQPADDAEDAIASGSTESDLSQPGAAASHEAAVAPQQQSVEPPKAQDSNAEQVAETPPAAHDALFAGGHGVEVVLERSSA